MLFCDLRLFSFSLCVFFCNDFFPFSLLFDCLSCFPSVQSVFSYSNPTPLAPLSQTPSCLRWEAVSTPKPVELPKHFLWCHDVIGWP